MRIVLLALLCAVASLTAFGMDRDRRLDQLLHTKWTAREGAPTNINAIEQTTDGYLWLGTARGLFRFDGIRFERYRPRWGGELPKSNIQFFTALSDGGLLLGYNSGGASLLKDDKLTNFGEAEGLLPSPILGVASGREGVIWAHLYNGSLVRFDGLRWTVIGVEANLPGKIERLFVDGRGTVWVTVAGRIFFLRDRERSFRRTNQTGEVFRTASDGSVWIRQPTPPGRRDFSTAWSRDDQLSFKIHFLPLPRLSGVVSTDSSEGMWVADTHGLTRLPYPERANDKSQPDAIQQFTEKDGLSSNYVSDVLEDREGNLWVATNLGLDRFRESALSPVAVPPGSRFFTLSEREKGGVWLSAWKSSSILRIQNGRIAGAVRSGDRIVSAYRDASGGVWMGKSQSGIILEVREDAVREHKVPVDSALTEVTKDALGRLWVLFAGKNFFRRDGKQWTSLASLGAPDRGALNAFTDSLGRVWFGFRDNRLVLLEGEKARLLTVKEGIAVGDVSIVRERHGSVWIAGDHGLQRFDGQKFSHVVPVDTKAFTEVSALIITAIGSLWLAESRGIVYIPPEEIQAVDRNSEHRVTYRIFDSLDGLPSQPQPVFPGPSAIETADGLIYFATANGVVWVDPKRIRKNTRKPDVSILPIQQDGKVYYPDSATGLQFPARTTSLNISYTATSLSIPERVRFRYRLEGSGVGWEDAGTRREVLVGNLSPGHHRFQVIACNEDGVWNEAGATFGFTIEPAFHQTVWFRLLIAAFVAAGVWMLYLYRVQQVTAQLQEQMGARLEERERIARELHDTLLQGFQSLILRFQAVVKLMPENGPSRQMMEEVLDRADRVLIEGRQSVKDLRDESITKEDLPRLLRLWGEELAKDNRSVYSLTVVGTERSLNPIVLKEVYRIACEAISNSFMHSGGSLVDVHVTYAARTLSVAVRDNGAGMSQRILESGKSGHWGLSGMRERARKIGAQLVISSSATGTTVEATIKAKLAYERADKRPAWFRFGAKE